MTEFEKSFVDRQFIQSYSDMNKDVDMVDTAVKRPYGYYLPNIDNLTIVENIEAEVGDETGRQRKRHKGLDWEAENWFPDKEHTVVKKGVRENSSVHQLVRQNSVAPVGRGKHSYDMYIFENMIMND